MIELLFLNLILSANTCVSLVTNIHMQFYFCFIIAGNFTSPTDLNLIIARNSQLEIDLVTPEGLRPLKEVNINGQISVIRHFRPQDGKKDLLFILTHRHNVMILECRMIGDQISVVTKAHGNVSDQVSKPIDGGIIAVIDPKARVIGMCLYKGLFTIIPLDKETSELKATNLRMDELIVYDVEFLYGCINPTIIVIHKDNDGRHVKTHEINLRDKEFMKIAWKQDNVETEATMLIPVPTPLGNFLFFFFFVFLYNDFLFCLLFKVEQLLLGVNRLFIMMAITIMQWPLPLLRYFI